MSIICTLACQHEIGWGDSPETPGADLPWVGRMAWCHDCETESTIVGLDAIGYVVCDGCARMVVSPPSPTRRVTCPDCAPGYVARGDDDDMAIQPLAGAAIEQRPA